MSEKGSTNRDPSRRETLVRGALMAAIGSVAVIYFVVSVFRPPLKADNFTNSYSTSPGGHFALVELLRENKREVRTVNKSLRPPEDQYNETDTLTLLEPGPQYVEHYSSEFEELFDLARERYSSVMLVLPKRHYVVGESDPDDPDALFAPLADRSRAAEGRTAGWRGASNGQRPGAVRERCLPGLTGDHALGVAEAAAGVRELRRERLHAGP